LRIIAHFLNGLGMVGHGLEWEDVVGWKSNNRNVSFSGKKADVSSQEFGRFCFSAHDKKRPIERTIQSAQ
jgi:hypothetical protein